MSLVATDALARLIPYLEREGLGDFFAAFNPLVLSTSAAGLARLSLQDELPHLVDLFVLGRSVPRSTLPSSSDELFDRLLELRLLFDEGDGELSMRDLMVVPVLENWLICQRPQLRHSLYLGADSAGLLSRLRPAVGGGAALDLCCGPGVQALHLSRFYRRVVGLEVNPVAAALAGINARLNGVESRMEVCCGDLGVTSLGERFDTIVANPPLLPVPEMANYPFVGAGGRDGFAVSRLILERLPELMADGGSAHIIGTCPSDGVLAVITDELAQYSEVQGLSVTLQVLSHAPAAAGDEMLRRLVGTTATPETEMYAEVEAAYLELLASQDATHICFFSLHVRSGRRGFRLLDFSDIPGTSLWHI